MKKITSYSGIGALSDEEFLSMLDLYNSYLLLSTHDLIKLRNEKLLLLSSYKLKSLKDFNNFLLNFEFESSLFFLIDFILISRLEKLI
jgi:hypothetical protein